MGCLPLVPVSFLSWRAVRGYPNRATWEGKGMDEGPRQGEELMRKMATASSEETVRKVIPFRNDDVPRFLRRLRQFQEQSRKARFMAT